MGNEYIALDIGGGSTELIEVKDNQLKQVNSLPIGAAKGGLRNLVIICIVKLVLTHQKKARKYARIPFRS